MKSITKKEEKLQLLDYLIPLRSNDKQPWIKRPPYTWKRRFSYPDEFPPGCNYGLRLGMETSQGYLIAVDYDGRRSFPEFLEELRNNDIPETLTVKTGGNHDGYRLFYWLTAPPDFTETNGAFHDVKIELLGPSHYVVIPPSVVYGPYECLDGLPSNLEGFLSESLEHAATLEFPDLLTLQNTITNKPHMHADYTLQARAITKCAHTQTRQTRAEISNKLLVYSYLLSKNLVYLPLGLSLIVWTELLTRAHLRLYGRSFTLPIKSRLDYTLPFKNFLCPFHKEEKPSAGLFLVRGKFMFRDFHPPRGAKQGRHYCFSIEQVARAILNEQEPEYIPAHSREATKALIELFDWIQATGLITEFGHAFNHWAGPLQDMQIQDYGVFPDCIVDTLKVAIETARPRVNVGHFVFPLTVRHVAEKAGWNYGPTNARKIANRAINFLVFSGILEKGGYMHTPDGMRSGRPTYEYRFNYEKGADDIRRAWERLRHAGLANYNRFNHENIMQAYGKELADYIFRRKAENREAESGEWKPRREHQVSKQPSGR